MVPFGVHDNDQFLDAMGEGNQGGDKGFVELGVDFEGVVREEEIDADIREVGDVD